MMVPFLEVVLHTGTEVMGRGAGPRVSPNGRVHQVEPAQDLHSRMSKPFILPAWVGGVGRLLLPTISLLFTVSFWIFGLIVSNWPNTRQMANMTECLQAAHN